MGIYAIAAVIVGLLATLRAFGLGGYIVREANLSEAEIRTVFTVNLLLAILTSGLVIVAAEAGGALLREPGVRDVLRVLAIGPLVSALEFLPNARMEREGAFRTIGLVGLERDDVTLIRSCAARL